MTNHHVAVSGGHSVIRLNRIDGGVALIEPTDWEFIPGSGDVAAAHIAIDRSVHKVSECHSSFFLSQEESKTGFIGAGDDVFMVGRFVDHDGGQSNSPALRFGNISVDPSSIPDTRNSKAGVHYFCLDMHSRTGFSGSPVFAFRTPGADLNQAFGGNLVISSPVLKLLGVHCGQFPEDMVLEGEDRPVRGYSGMTYALPAWAILELLNCPRFAEARAAMDVQLVVQSK